MQVGNDSTISILEDPWLHLEHEAFVQTNNLALPGKMVTSLLSDNGNWDVDLINDVFNNRDANIILSIPLNSESQDTW